MKKKIVGVLVCTLLIATAVLPATSIGTKSNADDKQSASIEFDSTVSDGLDLTIDPYDVSKVFSAEQPEPFFVIPSDGDLVYGEVHLWAGEASGVGIMVTRFYYSLDGENWHLIGEDWDGSEPTDTGRNGDNKYLGDGWSVYWDVSDFDDGLYYIKARMWTFSEDFWCTDISVYVDSTPPIPTFYEPLYDEVVDGNIYLRTTATDENIDHVVYHVLAAPEYYEKGVPEMDQHDYLKNFNGKDLRDVGCAVVSAASCLRYWNKTGFPQIMRKDPDDPSKGYMNDTELVEKLAELANTDENGTTPSNLTKALKQFLNEKKVGCTNPNGLKVTYIDWKKCNFSRYKKELEANKEDVLWRETWNTSTKDAQGNWIWGGHMMTANSVNDTVLADSDGDGLKEHEVDIMDPWTGKIKKYKMNTDGTYRDGIWYYPNGMITISKKKTTMSNIVYNDWILIGTSTDPSGGWAVSWDTTTFPDGYYFIKATMIDEDGNQGEDLIVVKVDNLDINNPPNKPSKPIGPTSGKTGTSYTYSSSTTDPDGDKIHYLFDWGDGTYSSWIGPKSSGQTAEATHSWPSEGSFSVRAKAKDEHGEESPWSDPLSISIPKNKPHLNTPFLQFLQDFLQNYPILYQLLHRFLKL